MPIEPVPCLPGEGGGGTPPDPADLRSVSELVLCDENGPFIRRTVLDGYGDVVQTTDVDLEGDPYAPVGEVGVCGSDDVDCDPTPMCARLVGMTGPDQWVMPAGTESINLSVACGPITVTDCSGEATVINECSTSFSWAAPSTRCAPGQLCAPFTVDVPDGSAVYLNFLVPCGGE